MWFGDRKGSEDNWKIKEKNLIFKPPTELNFSIKWGCTKMQVSVGRLILFFWMYIWKKSSCNQRYKYSCRANFSLQNRRPASPLPFESFRRRKPWELRVCSVFHLKPEPKGTERNHPPLVDAFFRHTCFIHHHRLITSRQPPSESYCFRPQGLNRWDANTMHQGLNCARRLPKQMNWPIPEAGKMLSAHN